MGQPSGEVVARPLVARACGCLREFQHFAIDRYRAQRLAKFQKTRCEVCVAKLNEEQRLAAANVPKKGEAFKSLPEGAQFTITRATDGTWNGLLSAQEKTVEATGDSPHGVSLALARAWLTAMGVVIPREEAPPPPPPAPPAPRPTTSGSPRPSLTNRPVAPTTRPSPSTRPKPQ